MAKSKLLIECSDQEYDISKEDIYTYAEQIGIDVNSEKHLLWIAEKGLSETVPEPWLILSDEKDQVFYYNQQTHETSWHHPLDNDFAALVSEERSKSKSLNSQSSDYGFESKLSSLADAPPLSSSGRNSPISLKQRKKDSGLSGKKLEFGRIENRRGSQLTPVHLGPIKMPTASAPKSSARMSFMPKGSALTKNFRREKEDLYFENKSEDVDEHLYDNDSNGSVNSDEGSKYSYEDTDDEKQIHGLQPFDRLDPSHISPLHSADESPDPLDIKSPVQIRTKLSLRPESGLRRDQLENVYKRDKSPSLSLRKMAQPPLLKPLAQSAKKKGANKVPKSSKKAKNNVLNESDMYLDNKVSAYCQDEEQSMMPAQVGNKWQESHSDLGKKEKEKYEQILIDSSKKLEEEKEKLRDENSETISKIKDELQKNIKEEETVAQKTLQSLRESNKEKVSEEEKKLQRELETLSESLKAEIKKMEEKNASELLQKKKQLEDVFEKELDSLKASHNSKKKDAEESQSAEILSLQQVHEQKIEDLKNDHGKEISEVSSSTASKPKLQDKTQKLEKLIKVEDEKHKDLLKKNENILQEINSKENCLEKLKAENTKLQATIEELQDDIEKTENELDLLRSEKSGLVSELNILKTNINNEKSNVLSFGKKLSISSGEMGSRKELSDIGVNTNLTLTNQICKAVQASVSCRNVSSQIDRIAMSNAVCQTAVLSAAFSQSCQTDLVHSANERKFVGENDNRAQLDTTAASDKNLENALVGLSVKLDSRINIIEHQLRSLQENFSRSAAPEPADCRKEFARDKFAKIKTGPDLSTFSDTENRNIPSNYFPITSELRGFVPNNQSVSSNVKCSCELGDTASCKVLQDVKNSVYRLNDILCANFTSPLNSGSIYQVTQPLCNYSSPFDNFYAQFRQMQERNRLTELRHKCDDDVIKITTGISSELKDTKTFGNLFSHPKPQYNSSHQERLSYNAFEDPMVRARNIVLREKAKSWKEQQSLNASVPHFLSVTSSECSGSLITGFASSPKVPSSEQTFVNFDADPETDHNMWMTRLNALQLRIRSHKML